MKIPRLLLLALVGTASAAFAQDKRAMTIVDLIEVPQLLDPQLSPDGTQLVYVLAEADWKAR